MPCFSCRTAEDDICLKAAKNDHIDCLQQAREMGFKWNYWTTSFAAAAGSLRCLQYAVSQGCDWNEDVCTLAAKFGHLDCLSFAHANGCAWNSNAPIYAAKMGQLACLQYLYINNCPWDNKTVFEAAILSNQLHCADFTYSRGQVWDLNILESRNALKKLCRSVILKGDLATLQYLQDKGCPAVYGFKIIDRKLCIRNQKPKNF